MSENSSCKDCRAHSGITRDIEHLEASDKNQWKEINGMKKWLIGTLTASVLSLVGIVVTLAITIGRAKGAAP